MIEHPVLSDLWWADFLALGNRMVYEAYQFDIYCAAGTLTEQDYYA